MIWDRENIPGLKIDRRWKWLLLPGLIIQWLLYMNPPSGVGAVVTATRHARSPLMTYAYSAAFYVGILLIAAELAAK